MSSMKTRSGSRRTPSRLKHVEDKLIKSNKKVLSGKSARKKLIMEDGCVNQTTLTDESVLHEIVALSPLSKNRHSKENIKPAISNCYSLSSPLRDLSIYSPSEKTKPGLQNSIVQDDAFKSPRKRMLEDTTKVMLQTLNIQAQTPSKCKLNESKLVSKESSSEENTCNFLTPTKKARSCGNDKNLESPFTDKNKDKHLLTTPIQSPSVQKRNTCGQKRSIKKCISTTKDPFSNLKTALHNSAPDDLIGRKSEQAEITAFIESHTKSKTSASIYVSGAPGTGKSACLSQIISNASVSEMLETVVLINCMTVRTAQKIYQSLAIEIGATSAESKSIRNASSFVEQQLTKDGPMILLVLDEMDQLDSKNQEVLYTMFGWTTLKNSRLILVGIANSLNLTDRLLPRLQAKASLKPKLVNFKPYTRDELVQILQARIQNSSLDNLQATVIESSALQFCARKVAATSGDARKALDICRRAVEVLETSHAGVNPLIEAIPKQNRVGLMQISRVISGACDSANICKSTEDPDADDGFPLQQKLLVCSLILLCRNIKCKEAPMGKLHEAYTKICKKRQVSVLNQSEFYAMSELVEARGIITVKKAKQQRQSQVKLNIQENEVEFALKGKALLSSILQNGF